MEVGSAADCEIRQAFGQYPSSSSTSGKLELETKNPGGLGCLPHVSVAPSTSERDAEVTAFAGSCLVWCTPESMRSSGTSALRRHPQDCDRLTALIAVG